jgi:hypothetical protein
MVKNSTAQRLLGLPAQILDHKGNTTLNMTTLSVTTTFVLTVEAQYREAIEDINKPPGKQLLAIS